MDVFVLEEGAGDGQNASTKVLQFPDKQRLYCIYDPKLKTQALKGFI